MPPSPPPELLYRTMATDWLRLLREAFLHDRAATVDPAVIAFCDGRVAVIERVLATRKD